MIKLLRIILFLVLLLALDFCLHLGRTLSSSDTWFLLTKNAVVFLLLLALTATKLRQRTNLRGLIVSLVYSLFYIYLIAGLSMSRNAWAEEGFVPVLDLLSPTGYLAGLFEKTVPIVGVIGQLVGGGIYYYLVGGVIFEKVALKKVPLIH